MAPEYKAQLDYLIKNLPNDWAFTILITGRGEVRVGKSIIGMQTAFYWITEVNRLYPLAWWNKYKKFTPSKAGQYDLTTDGNYVFNGGELIKKGNRLGVEEPFTAIVYDEAGADIQGVKIMNSETKEVLDYLRECGQYNMLTILILPDYFSLPRGIALTYSVFLLDVTYYADEEGIFRRGSYNFYNRNTKKKLYLWGKKYHDYDCVQPNFRGQFTNVYTIDEQEYRQAKRDALKKREKPLSKKERNIVYQRNITWYKLHYDKGMTYVEICNMFQGIDGIDVNEGVIVTAISEAKKFLEK